MNPKYRPEPHYKEYYRKELNRYSVWAGFDNEKSLPALQCNLFPETKEIFIDDFTVGDRNHIEFYTRKGYYSEIMNILLAFAKQNRYQKICGELKAFDISRRDKQIRFYEKFGFTISEPNENKDRLIELIINYEKENESG